MKFSKNWIKSKNARKQRNYKTLSPLHIKKNFVSVKLSKELSKKSNRRSFGIKKGDKVKILRGQFKGSIGKVDRVSIKLSKVYVEGADIVKKDGSKTLYPIHPSNLMIEEINLDDKKRKQKFEKVKKDDKKSPKKSSSS